MPDIKADEECVLCLGTGWVFDTPTVLGQNEDGTDILSDSRVRMCRCVVMDETYDDDEDEDFDDESIDEEQNGPASPYNFGGSLVLA